MTLSFTGWAKITLAASKSTKERLEGNMSGGTLKESTMESDDSSEALADTVSRLQKQVEDLNSRLENVDLEKVAEILPNLPDSSLVYIAIGVAIGALLVSLLGFWILNSKNAGYASDIKWLREELEHQKNLLDRLKERLEEQPETPVRRPLARESFYQGAAFPMAATTPLRPEPVPVPQAPEQLAPKPSQSELLQAKCNEFAREYNRIQSITGISAREAKLDFQRRYDLCGLICINAQERVNHPERPPQFDTCESLMDATLWGFRIGTYYAVAPNPRQYVGTDHNYGGMKELFVSNFRSGSTYSKIDVRRPAILTQNLQIMRQGELGLS